MADKQSEQGAGLYIETHPEQSEPAITHVPHGKYGLSRETLLVSLKSQKGHCAICGKRKYLILDHNHENWQARGYVCQRCNILVAGHENKELNVKISKYLDNPPLAQFYT